MKNLLDRELIQSEQDIPVKGLNFFIRLQHLPKGDLITATFKSKGVHFQPQNPEKEGCNVTVGEKHVSAQ